MLFKVMNWVSIKKEIPDRTSRLNGDQHGLVYFDIPRNYIITEWSYIE
jgi:hypothetical protein